MKKNEPSEEYEPVEVYCSLLGEHFFPSRLKVFGKVELINAKDPGDIGQTGKYRGKPIPYGTCEVKCTLVGRTQIVYLATHLKRYLPQYKKNRATNIVFWILWRGLQGNMEFTVQELRKLADMKIPVAMDYIHMET